MAWFKELKEWFKEHRIIICFAVLALLGGIVIICWNNDTEPVTSTPRWWYALTVYLASLGGCLAAWRSLELNRQNKISEERLSELNRQNEISEDSGWVESYGRAVEQLGQSS